MQDFKTPLFEQLDFLQSSMAAYADRPQADSETSRPSA